jgi:hypothetical protein
MFVDQFYKIACISQTVHQIELQFYREILDIWNYIMVIVPVKLNSVTYYFRGLKLLDKSCQIYQVDLRVMFGTYLTLQVRVCYDSSWDKN